MFDAPPWVGGAAPDVSVKGVATAAVCMRMAFAVGVASLIDHERSDPYRSENTTFSVRSRG